GDILKEVSRSFYITLQLLPKRVRGPICLGYLLARTSDTIADTESVPSSERLVYLARFGQAVHQTEGVAALQTQLQEQFQPLQSDSGETKLLDHTEEAVHWLGAVSEFERGAVRDVITDILRGQSLDCERFGDPGNLRFLPQGDQLEEYTYLVAGSVGVFWTRLCFHHWTKFARESEEQMLVWAKSYGRALQLINVLRDLPKDLENGRCYLPVPEAVTEACFVGRT
ncbi:MAG: squalene/phytoene synthase family protein, partial [Verrucomicrobiales bacterium]